MKKRKERLLYIDNIRWVMIILVVLMHLNVTYSNGGLWYYTEPGNIGILSGLLFGIYGSLNQAYMMGLLFLIAGYFVPGSFDKKGAGLFVKDRLIRLGIPTLAYMLLIHPVTMLITDAFNNSIPQNLLSWYMNFLVSFSFLSASGPLWFAFALLIFTLIYTFIQKMFLSSKNEGVTTRFISITNGKVFALIGIITIFAFTTRIFIPAGMPLFNTLPGNFMQLGYFPSYIVLFVVGIMAYRLNILSKLSYKFGKFWLKIALFLGFPLWLVVMITGGIMGNIALLFGGLTWQAAAYSAWESFFCVGISIGLITIFREKFNTQGKLSSFISKNAFGVYVFHAPILVAITMALRGVEINPVVKMYMVALIVLPVCFVFVHLIRKLSVIRKIFS